MAAADGAAAIAAADLALAEAADAAAAALANGNADSDDEADEADQYGLGAIAPARLVPGGAPHIGDIPFAAEASARAVRRRASQNVSSFAMTEQSWSSNDQVAARYIRFLAMAYGTLNEDGGLTIEEQGERLATTLDAALPHRLRRFLALLREGGRSHLVGGKNAPLAMRTIDNMASSLGYFYGKATRDFAGEQQYVPGCASRNQAWELIPLTARTDDQTARGETHKGNPLKSEVVQAWLAGAGKNAVQLGECSAQTPPVTADNMTAACALATEFSDAVIADDAHLTVQQVEWLTLYTVMVFSWCTMLRPVNLLGLVCQDICFAPLVGANAHFFEQHGRPRWVRVAYSRLKTNVAGTNPVPAYYFWSCLATEEEMRTSEHAAESACVRCPFQWCDLPHWSYVYTCLRLENPGFDMRSVDPFFVTPIGGDAEGVGGLSNHPIDKDWWRRRLDLFVLRFDPALSARGMGGLYGFRRGATQFWLNHTGDIETVLRMGVWRRNSTRFLFYLLNYQCRGTLRVRVQDFLRRDEADIAHRLDSLVGQFMVWFEGRLVVLLEENFGNFFAAGFGVEVAGKMLELVKALLDAHGGVGEGDAL